MGLPPLDVVRRDVNTQIRLLAVASHFRLSSYMAHWLLSRRATRFMMASALSVFHFFSVRLSLRVGIEPRSHEEHEARNRVTILFLFFVPFVTS